METPGPGSFSQAASANGPRPAGLRQFRQALGLPKDQRRAREDELAAQWKELEGVYQVTLSSNWLGCPLADGF